MVNEAFGSYIGCASGDVTDTPFEMKSSPRQRTKGSRLKIILGPLGDGHKALYIQPSLWVALIIHASRWVFVA
jgi:hypothetical protein